MPHLLIVIANYEDKFPDSGLFSLNKQMLQDRFIGYRQHYLGSGVGEGAHPVAFPGG